ncbi:hypothetical protein H5V45_00170 [Nocardioides sp. KIGAM211]|uniref:Uncharacterized protein n=1 Tax=Nocardioides luti TaxID=2761101 RepID=A0A7X0V8P0_9ACTN|nr:hypothetical protein [Nocardioides luti]MBB6625721.1 hypothetical protein [Nocardioides luti]
MRRLVVPLVALLAPSLLGPVAPSGASEAREAGERPVAHTSCRVFPADNYWHADVSALPRHPRSRQWLRHMSPEVALHPDFGPSYGDGPGYGIPVTVVRPGHRRVRVRFDYADESDRVRYPLGRDTRIEGGRGSGGDRHAIVVDRGACRLYETYATRATASGWRAGSGAVWSLDSNDLRPDGWTSADAAGLPILPGLLRWNEVRARHVDHAIRFTTDVTSRHHLWPARHDAGSRDSLAYPPMGARFRLRAGFRPEGFSAGARAVVAAMKTYGLVLADNGSPWFFQGERNAHWPTRLVEDLKRIPASAFVAVDTSGLQVSADSAATQQPDSELGTGLR